LCELHRIVEASYRDFAAPATRLSIQPIDTLKPRINTIPAGDVGDGTTGIGGGVGVGGSGVGVGVGVGVLVRVLVGVGVGVLVGVRVAVGVLVGVGDGVAVGVFVGVGVGATTVVTPVPLPPPGVPPTAAVAVTSPYCAVSNAGPPPAFFVGNLSTSMKKSI
jgi:hypothetical protein